MIPLRLELKNFMSYGEEGATLDLAGMHMLSLTGENGNGKSALLDAITWALWGESRAGKNRHDDLVRIGSDEMSVTLTFEVDGQTFRVLRKRSKKASGNQWELQQQDGEMWRALTGNKSGDTGDTIQRLLRMSYDTFLNSAYLRQGQADHFVQQTPGKRKEILADILDLSRYDKLEARAKVIANDAKADAVDLERDLNSLDAELSEEPALRESIAALQAEHAAAHARADLLRAEYDAVQVRLRELGQQKDAADSLREQAALCEREITEYDRDAHALRAEIAAADNLLSRRADIEARHALLLEVRATLPASEEDVRQFYRGRDALAAAQRDWDSAEHALRLDVQMAQDRHSHAAEAAKEVPMLREQGDVLRRDVEKYDALARDAADADTLLPAAQDGLSALKEEDARIGAQIAAWQERLDALAQKQGACRVCNAKLSPERAAAVREEYQVALDDLALRRKDGRGDGQRARMEVAALQERVNAWRAVQKAAGLASVKLGQAEQKLLTLETAASDVTKLAAHLAEVSGVLQSGMFAPEIKARLAKIDAALSRFANAETALTQARERASLLAPAERESMELGVAETARARAADALARTETALTAREAAREGVLRQLSALADVAPETARLTAQSDDVLAQGKECRRLESSLDQQIGSLTQRLERLASLRVQKKEKGDKLSAAKRKWEVHDQLARAFGKKGVQALIIDNAVPELQDEANRLLDRLTEGDMSLFIETVREGKAKNSGPVETLDIKVSDSLGTRPLEMYSGGEGFRAAFALRIALSRLLSRRAGAKLQTLIIDEGFGTQDGKGREKLVDALHTIGPDFERIIVITHIDELKDAFPTRVEVVKTPTGSQITVLEGAAG